MGSYTIPIFWAFALFPFIAIIFTIPYILVQYHKYGSIPVLRVCIVYSFILYLMSSLFLVILPLPSIEEVRQYTTPTTQLIPFTFIMDFIKYSSFVWSDPSTYLKALSEPLFYQVAYNILLFVPLGMYLRYYFKCSLKKTIVIVFSITLFFELTQLTGLYGIYPRGYRLFDVDDLFINTIGGIIGFLVAKPLSILLPSRDKLDEYAYKKGKEVSILKRFVGLTIDILLIGIINIIIQGIIIIFQSNQFIYSSILSCIIYFLIIPIITRGRTLSKLFLNLKLITKEDKKPKVYQYISRYFLLYGVALPLPFYIFYCINTLPLFIPTNKQITLIISLLIFTVFSIIYYGMNLYKLIKQKPLWYENITNTKNISTILEESQDDETIEKEGI